MKRNLLINTLLELSEKTVSLASLFLTMILVVRFLPREEYGALGISAGVLMLVQIINVSLDSLLLRQRSKNVRRLPEFLGKYIAFTSLKILALVVGASIAIGLAADFYGNDRIGIAAVSVLCIVVLDAWISPFSILASSQFRHDLVLRLSVSRHAVSILMLSGLFVFPTLEYLLIKELVLLVVFGFLWPQVVCRGLSIGLNAARWREWFQLSEVWQGFLRYSIWTHLVGYSTAFVYKSDTLFLGSYQSLESVGDYNVALTAANTANVAPMVLAAQTSVAISRTNTEREAQYWTNYFLRFSLVVCFLTMVAFVVFGEAFLVLITGQQSVSDIYFAMICIVAGLVITKSIASPIASFINLRGEPRDMFMRVSLPVMVAAVACYWFGAAGYGVRGVALANVVVSLFWVLLLMQHLRRLGFEFEAPTKVLSDLRALITART